MKFLKKYSMIFFISLAACNNTIANNGHAPDNSPFMNNMFATQLYKYYKLKDMVFYHWNSVVGSQLKALHDKGTISKKLVTCISRNTATEINEPVYRKFVEITPPQLIANNVRWAMDGFGEKIQEKGIRDADDPDMIYAIKNKTEIIDVLGYLKQAAYSELALYNFEKEKERCAINNYKSKYE